ncbi:hypothetical protein PPERSA_07467 [Pseudocohnilembus persalinus]|uniref:Uncharacterized protein n=1 Tax=Pseudocohnilembus persalinus TaxID=266149 RepID=A0A0V0QAH7_PSEPJ|nr:hypothetical protein PPERSA_07467 [Pseudocohnilembus persalinus]|eukprot:KRW99224.1 hypothetical protein PPERSA_07467 [Pseudocohnilembus persalinus]
MSLFGGISNFIGSFKQVKDSDFEQNGLLTPQQFVLAGDQLLQLGWQWKKAQNSNKVDKNLPIDKQFLQIEQVNCEKRIKEVFKQHVDTVNQVEGFEIPNFKENNQDIVDCRTYNISITYDDYYHVPRLWLTGFTEDQKPLNRQQILQDITDEQDKFATLEDHPRLEQKQVTIHPCRHSERLKAFVKEAKQRGINYKPEQALLIFLQFMPSIMPTMELDMLAEIPL